MKKKKCCICIPLREGVTILGFLSLIICILEWVLTTAFKTDAEDGNSIESLREKGDHIVSLIKDLARDKFDISVEEIKTKAHMLFNYVTGSAIVFGGTCILLMIGVQVQKQSLMIPYLIVQMLMIVMTAIAGIPIAVGLFYLKHPLYGLSVTIAVFFTAILPIYFWFTVKRAYTEIAKTGKLSMSRNKSNLECGKYCGGLSLQRNKKSEIGSQPGNPGTLDMGYCFFCVPLLEGILVQGFLSLIMCILGFVSTAYGDNVFNPLYHFLNHINTALEESNEKESIVSIETINTLKNHGSLMFNLATAGVIAYVLSCFMMIIGTQFRKYPCLMIPFLIAQMFWIVLDILIGVPLAVILFYLNHSKDGQIVTSFVLLTSIMSFYFWMNVNKAYKKLAGKKTQNKKSTKGQHIPLKTFKSKYKKTSNPLQNDECDIGDKEQSRVNNTQSEEFLCCESCLRPLGNWYEWHETRIAVYSTMFSFVASNIILASWDTGSDIITATHHFMHNNPIYGSFTVLFMIVPTILAIVAVIIEVNTKKESDRYPKNIVRFLKCLLHLPIIQLFKTFVFGRKLWKVAKEKEKVDNFASRMNKWIKGCGSLLIDDEWTWEKIKQTFKGGVSLEDEEMLKALFKQKCYACFNGQGTEILTALIKADQMEKADDMAKVKSETQEFKIFEAIGESAPQFILQASIIINAHPTMAYSNLELREILTLSSSFISVIWTVCSTFLKLPFIVNGKKEAPFNCWKNYLFVGPLVFFIVAPRLMALSMLFASFKGLICLGIIVVCLFIYAAIFWINVYQNLKTNDLTEDQVGSEVESESQSNHIFWNLIYLSFISSVIGPCVSIYPRSAFIFVSSSISMIAQVTLMAILQIVAHFKKDLLVEGFANEINTFEIFYWCLIPVVIFTSLGSYFLVEERRQLMSLKIRLGAICCDERDQIHWACKREHLSLVRHYLDSEVDIVNEINVDGQNAFHFSHENSKMPVMKLLLQHPKSNFDTTTLKNIFWNACYRGNTEILEVFLVHPQLQMLFTEKDYDGTGFNRACHMGKTKVIKFLLEHAGDVLDEMMKIRNGTGMTGFMLASQWNKVEVVQILIGSSIGKSDVYDGFILACQHNREKIIFIILQNDEFRKHILIEEKEKGKVFYPDDKIVLRQQILNQNQELVISFDAINQLDIEIKVNSILNEEEAEEKEARKSVCELKRMNLVTRSQLKPILDQSTKIK